MSEQPTEASTDAEGHRLVAQIMDRRLGKCIRAESHTAGHCRACGIHQ